MVHVPFLSEVIVFLVATVVVVPLARALRLSPILGYLAVGILAGPSGLGLVENVEEVRAFAELGVVFLLFAVGLELSFERLKTFAPMIFGLGHCTGAGHGCGDRRRCASIGATAFRCR